MYKQFDPPKPSADAMAHSEKLGELIRERIRAGDGWMDFAEFMDLALYAPGLGYYSAGARKFGAAGDFVTAPEISPLFSRCIARVVAEVFENLRSRVILEIGAGTGRMAAEIVHALRESGVELDRYMILEVSADLRERQRQTLQSRAAAFLDRVVWLDDLPDAPIEGVILANELLDALPVSRFEIVDSRQYATSDERVYSFGVGIEADRFCWRRGAASQSLCDHVRGIENELDAPLANGYVSEVSLGLPTFVQGLCSALRRGLILTIDYGLPRAELYHQDRRQGTLLCHYRHRAHSDPFLYPGLQDITAWVDFTTVAEAATAAGLRIAGFTTQAHFLIGAGLEQEFSSAGTQEPRRQLELSRELQMLTMPDQMGERFKVMGLNRDIDVVPVAFRYRDLCDRL